MGFAGGFVVLLSIIGIQGMSGGESFWEVAIVFALMFGLGFGLIGTTVGALLDTFLKNLPGLIKRLRLGLISFSLTGAVGGIFFAVSLTMMFRYERFFRGLTGDGTLGGFYLSFLLLSLGISFIGGIIILVRILRS
jgi:hypothetical protein